MGRLLVRFRYTVPEAGRLRFVFLDTTDERHVRMFSPSRKNQHRDARFTLDEGEHARVFQGMSGPFTRMYRYALRFDREPFPEGYQPERSILTYYGWPLDAP